MRERWRVRGDGVDGPIFCLLDLEVLDFFSFLQRRKEQGVEKDTEAKRGRETESGWIYFFEVSLL